MSFDEWQHYINSGTNFFPYNFVQEEAYWKILSIEKKLCMLYFSWGLCVVKKYNGYFIKIVNHSYDLIQYIPISLNMVKDACDILDCLKFLSEFYVARVSIFS